MLVEAQLSAGREHSADFTQCCGLVGNAAEIPAGDRRVEAPIASRETVGDTVHDLDSGRAFGGTANGFGPGGGVGLDGQNQLDRVGVVLEVAPVATAELDHAPVQPREQAPAVLTHDGIGPSLLEALEIARESRLTTSVDAASVRADLALPNRLERYRPDLPISSIR